TTAPAADTSPPVLINPEFNGAANVATNVSLGLAFDEPVEAGSGHIAIHNADGSVFDTIDITDAAHAQFFNLNGFYGVSITPHTVLADAHSYYVTVGSGAIQDLAGNPYAGFSSSSVDSFTTADIHPPELQSMWPAGGSNTVSVDGIFILTFNEPVQ